LIEQARGYTRQQLSSDLIAALVVTIMLIPQSLAYAMLAGLPPEYGLYSSILPLVAYSFFGSCRTLAVGPVAIASLMTASALNTVTQQGLIGYVEGAMLLALLSGSFLFLLGMLRLGFLSNFLSHSVVVGFITASGLLIALSQLKHIFGIGADGHNFLALAASLTASLAEFNVYTLCIGFCSIGFLFWARRGATKLLISLGMNDFPANSLAKAAPIVGVIITTVLVAVFSLQLKGVAIIGQIPSGLPAIGLPAFTAEAAQALLIPAMLISIIGYVESVSVGRTLAAKKRQKINANQELLGLGAANLASSMSGGFPVTGGFARSVVNFDARAQTQFAGLFTAAGIALTALFLTPLLFYLPVAMLAATIIVAVLSLVNFSIFIQAWRFSKSDFVAVLVTVILTLTHGVELGVASGIVASILLHLYRTSVPHIAEIGLIEGSQHFRNIKHFKVITHPSIVSLRIDESLIFSNTGYLEDYINAIIANRPEVTDLVLHCGAINTIDLTALDMLIVQNKRLGEQGKRLHLSTVKVPVQALLNKVDFFTQLNGSLYLSHYDAFQDLMRDR
jgi:SulP family sulfate permease